MLRLRHKQFSLGIGLKDMSLVEANSLNAVVTLPLSEYLPGSATPQTADWAPSLDAVLMRPDMPAGGDVILTISDAWARYFTLQIPDGVGGIAELHALAASRFEVLFGTSPSGWSLEADWKASGQVLVCCLPSRLVDLAATLSAAGVWRVRSIQPYAMRLQGLFCSQIPEDGWLCCYARRSVVAMLLSAGEVIHVRRFPSAAPLTTMGIGSLLAAEAMRIGVESPVTLCSLGLLPKIPEDGIVGGMKLLLGKGPKLAKIKPGKMAESLCIARQGAMA